MTLTGALLEFIEARLADDDETARAVATWGSCESADPFLQHVCRHLPDRVLRRVAADRALLATGNDEALKALARVWSDHDDFDPEWAA